MKPLQVYGDHTEIESNIRFSLQIKPSYTRLQSSSGRGLSLRQDLLVLGTLVLDVLV